MDSVRHSPQHEQHKRLLHNPPRRLLHIEASGAEVAIQYELVVHIGHFSDLHPLKDKGVVLERVASFNGSIVPLIDIRNSAQGCGRTNSDDIYRDLLVISLNGQLIAVRVERVIDLLLVAPLNIEPLRTGLAVSSEFIVAMVCLPRQRLPLVDMKKLLSPGLAPFEREQH